MAEARGFEPRMGVNPNRISSPFGATKAPTDQPRLTQSAQVSGVTPCKAPEPGTARRKLQCAKNVPPQTLLQPGPPHARERIRRPLVTHPRYRKDNPMNDPTAKTTADWPGIAEAAGLLYFRIGEWHDFGYVTPPAPHCKTIPPLGERSAEAIKGGHGAIEVIDEIVRDLYRLREQLIGELRADEDIRAVRAAAVLSDGRAQPEDIPQPPGLPGPCSTPALHAAGRCACAGIGWTDTAAAERAAADRAKPASGCADPECVAQNPELHAPPAPAPASPASRAALRAELAELRQEREAWEETARACVCSPGVCTRGEFRDHAGESEGCMVCADLDPEQPCYAAVARVLQAREEVGR